MKKVFIISGMIVLVVGTAVILSQNLAHAEAKDKGKQEAEKKEEKKETIYTVDLFQVDGREIRTFVSSTATLKADRQVDIYSKLAGQISEVLAEEGDLVQKGGKLMVLDGDEKRLQLEQAMVNLTKAESDYERIKKSYQKELVSTEEHDAKAYELKRARAEYNLAAHQVELTEVIAPFSGTIITRDAEVGQTIQPSQKLFSLAALNPLEAEVFLTEEQVARLKQGQEVTLSRQDDYGQPFTGKVIRIAPVVDKDTGTVKVTLAIHNAPNHVRPGTYVHFKIVTDTQMVPTVVPEEALVFDSRQHAHVFLTQSTDREDGALTVKKIEVETGTRESGYVAITSGLNRGDIIVMTGKESLKDGGLVKDAAKTAEQNTASSGDASQSAAS